MKKFFYFLSVLFILISPSFSNSYNEYKVIKIIDGDTVYIDFNKNNIPDKNERVRLNGIDTFETKPNERLYFQMKTYNLDYKTALGLGYLGKEFAKKELLNKYVKVEYTADTKLDKNNRHLLSIYYNINQINGYKSYEQEILKEGLAKVYNKSNLANDLLKYENLEKFQNNIKNINKYNLVILNKNTKKYHTLDCKYAWLSCNIEIVKQPKFYYTKSHCCSKNK